MAEAILLATLVRNACSHHVDQDGPSALDSGPSRYPPHSLPGIGRTVCPVYALYWRGLGLREEKVFALPAKAETYFT